jgi:hypothetical protein
MCMCTRAFMWRDGGVDRNGKGRLITCSVILSRIYFCASERVVVADMTSHSMSRLTRGHSSWLCMCMWCHSRTLIGLGHTRLQFVSETLSIPPAVNRLNTYTLACLLHTPGPAPESIRPHSCSPQQHLATKRVHSKDSARAHPEWRLMDYHSMIGSVSDG